MPAIHLTRLNAEVKDLSQQFGNLDQFTAGLTEIYERYAPGSFRRGELTRQNIQIPQYYLPNIVVQKLIQAVRPRCQNDPEQARMLAEQLWQGSHLEIRQFAISILTTLPLQDPQQFMNTIQRWLSVERETYLITDLVTRGCSQLRVDFPEFWLARIADWLESKVTKEQQIGLHAAIASVKDPDFNHLPNLYRLSTDLITSAPQQYNTLLQELVEAMARRAPAETSFFLQQILLRSPSKETARIVRRKLSLLPAAYQTTLRTLLADLNTNDALN